MAEGRAPSNGSSPLRSFSLEARPRTVDAGEERRFRHGIRAALRVAAGVRCAFRIRWRSGPSGGVSVDLPDTLALSWFRHAMIPIYDPGQWRIGPVPLGAGTPVRFVGLAGPASLPLPCAADRPPWAEPILLGLRARPGGLSLEWRLDPAPPRLVARAPSEVARSPDRGRGSRGAPPSTALDRAVRDGSDERRLGVPWVIRAELRAYPQIDAEELARCAGLVAAASRLEGGNSLRLVRPILGLRPKPPGVLLSESEVMGLFPTPWARFAFGPGPLPGPGTGLFVGRDAEGSAHRIPVEPAQGRHLLIVGETGMGKSSTLLRLLAGATASATIVLLDPIGDTGRRFLGGLEERAARRVLWVSPRDSPLPLNALALVGGKAGPSVTSPRLPAERSIHELVSALHRVRSARFAEGGFWGPRVEEVLGRALSLAAGRPRGTLTDAYRLLESDPPEGIDSREALPGSRAFRQFVLEHPEEVGGARRVLGEIVRNEVLRRLLCEPDPPLRLDRLVAPGAITVVTADAPEVGENTARHLLAVYLALLWSELLSRTQPTKVIVGLEEAQWYAHEGVAELLRLGRRGNIHLWTATQSLRAFPESLREALLTNCADLLLFRGDPEEMREFSRWSRTLTLERLMALPRGQAALLVGKGSDIAWLTIPPLSPERQGAERREAARRATAELGEGERTPTGEATVGEDPPRPSGPSPRVLHGLLARWAEGFREGPWRVGLRELRESCGASEGTLRELGSTLRRTRRLLRRTDGTDGPSWELAAGPWEPGGELPLSAEEESTVRRFAVEPLPRASTGPGK